MGGLHTPVLDAARTATRTPAARASAVGGPRAAELSAAGTSGRTTLVHRLPAEAKLLAHLAFVLVVVATPGTWYWAFAAYAALLGATAVATRLRPGFLLRRMGVELPFLGFALLMPFISTGERTTVLGLSVSVHGLVAAWTLLAKATLGVLASVLLAATTEVRDLLAALRVLHAPDRMVQIAAFMVRYLGVVQGEAHRMRVARDSRAFEARHLGHVRVVAQSAGALFVRTYERGERVHLAMLARGGGDGPLPLTTAPSTAAAPAGVAAVLPLAALAVLLAGLLLGRMS